MGVFCGNILFAQQIEQLADTQCAARVFEGVNSVDVFLFERFGLLVEELMQFREYFVVLFHTSTVALPGGMQM